MNRLTRIKNLAVQRLNPSVISSMEKGGQKLYYISGTTVMDMLTAAFDSLWSVQYSQPWINKFEPLKNGYEPDPVVTVKATLTIPIFDEETKTVVTVTREGFGTAVMKKKFEEMVLKTASTDALKKAAYSFGIGGELFRNQAEQNFFYYLTSDWTPELQTVYSNEWALVRSIAEQYGFNNNIIGALVQRFTEGECAMITPKNIVDFTAWLDSRFRKEVATTPTTQTLALPEDQFAGQTVASAASEAPLELKL